MELFNQSVGIFRYDAGHITTQLHCFTAAFSDDLMHDYWVVAIGRNTLSVCSSENLNTLVKIFAILKPVIIFQTSNLLTSSEVINPLPKKRLQRLNLERLMVQQRQQTKEATKQSMSAVQVDCRGTLTADVVSADRASAADSATLLCRWVLKTHPH